ncbi:hypothetical protein [Salisediminibacterium beveridgei]|uniref:Uncharacterized protein n=1 Tax=Salisediminibacterium beveridgei TaxID=632773 RepID=A0A1D7QVF8_9BACI|nr:hypothetical protein [Salisediminibacterium beveridgei]AOM83001.1 hypothetical protein BBEV_1640 [Salisediminibacterium beveridgei]
MNQWLGKVDIDDIHKFMIITSIIFLVSALFFPFVFIFIVQDILFHSRDHWYFGTPVTAYLLAGAGMLTFPAVAIIYSLFRMIRSRMVQKSGIISLVLLVMIGAGIPFYILGVNSYFIFDDQGVHKNEATTTQITSFKWEEVQYFIPEIDGEAGTASYAAFHFVNQEEKLISIPYSTDFSHLRSLIIEEIENYGGEVHERMTTEEWNNWKETRL